MSWEMYEAAKKIADGWYSELEATRMRNAVLGRDNAKLRELCADMLMSPQDYCEKYGIEYEGWSSADDHIDDRMRELGVTS